MLKNVAIAIVLFLICGCDTKPRQPCNTYSLYDDALTREIYEKEGISNPDQIREIRLFVVPEEFGMPCEYNHAEMQMLLSLTDKQKISDYLNAMKTRYDDIDIQASQHRMSGFVGMEFITKTGSMTYFEIWIYNEAAMIHPLPEKRLEYTAFGYESKPLLALLERDGVLDAMPGYAQFKAKWSQ